MSTKYEDYLETGTRKLIEFLSSDDIDDEERDSIVSAFSEELKNNICNTENLTDSEELIYRTSIKYNDKKISDVLDDITASYSDYEKAIQRCIRVRGMLQTFAMKKWQVPQLGIADLNKCEDTLRKRQESTSISSKIVEEDYKIDEMTVKAQSELTVQAVCCRHLL